MTEDAQQAMQVEAIAPFRHAGEPWSVGDRRTVDRALGDYLCRAGFVRDVAGIVQTGQPKPGERVYLNPADVRIKPQIPSV